MKRIFFLFAVLTAGALIRLDADELLKKFPHSPTIEGYFIEQMEIVHGGIWVTRSPAKLYSDISLKINDPFQINLFAGTMIPVTGHIAIPVFAEGVFGASMGYNMFSRSESLRYAANVFYGSEDRKIALAGMTGGGIIFHGGFGLLAAYAGYHVWLGDEHTVHVPSDDGGYTIETRYDYPSKINWAVFPLIDAKELPLLNAFVNVIDGYFQLDTRGMKADNFSPSYKANVLFSDIPLNNTVTLTFNTYTVRDWYDYNTKYNLWAGGLSFGGHLFDFSVDAGYRSYFETERGERYYENGVYAKITIGKEKFMLFAESGPRQFFGNPIVGMAFILGDLEEEFYTKMYLSCPIDGGLAGINFGFSLYWY